MHYCWFNGAILEANKLMLSYSELGFMRGYGLFDYFRTYNGRVFQWDLYWDRYQNSANRLRIANPILKQEAYEVVNKLVGLQGGNDCAVRFLLTGGFTEDSVNSVQPNLIIVTEDLHAYKESDYTDGIHVISREYIRDMYDVKSVDYKMYMYLQADIKLAQASDVLYVFEKQISELSRSNVFMINGNTLSTPNDKILHGITRRVVLELAADDFEIEERPIQYDELVSADEVFTTSTTRRIMPISKIDSYMIGEGKIGSKTQFLLDKINTLVKGW
ncbi:MAG: aminotransferase class IV [Leadbetterella sp.]